MNTDTMIALAVDTHADRVRAGDRERVSGQAVAGKSRRSILHDARFSIGATLIAAGGRLQGMATTLPAADPQVRAAGVAR